MQDNGVQKDIEVAEPPGKIYQCPLCFAWLHYSTRYDCWHCYECSSDWDLEGLLEIIEADEY